VDALEISTVSCVLSFFPDHSSGVSFSSSSFSFQDVSSGGGNGGGRSILASLRSKKGFSGMMLRRVNVNLEQAKVRSCCGSRHLLVAVGKDVFLLKIVGKDVFWLLK
jgi:hypothetical protein